jgi:tRNA-specific 2-thiouridylase
VSLRYKTWQCPGTKISENICCSQESFQIAKKICRRLKIPHYIIDVAPDFQREVIGYFTDELIQSRTPSPCVFCNRNLKFKKLLEFAKKVGARYVATGHYARISKNPKTGLFELKVAKDKKKDQTYSLCFLPQGYLERIIFPLGNLTKERVYQIAKKQEGFEVYEKRKQSQDFCFIQNELMEKFLKREIGVKKGHIVSENGQKIGEHKGLHFYTIGQRKGIRLPGGPYYVIEKDTQTNALVVSKDKSSLLKKETLLYPVFFSSGKFLEEKLKIETKIRSSQPLVKAEIEPMGKNKIRLIFSKPQPAVTAGQIAVFYKGEVCLGGGVIN